MGKLRIPFTCKLKGKHSCGHNT
uniref:Uncharacterized protein n=1 Tax=Anguilla anguilla TaxID=7936 RepID=A0A0E9Q573_ANGAN